MASVGADVAGDDRNDSEVIEARYAPLPYPTNEVVLGKTPRLAALISRRGKAIDLLFQGLIGVTVL
jgi:hypothetical protein